MLFLLSFLFFRFFNYCLVFEKTKLSEFLRRTSKMLFSQQQKKKIEIRFFFF